LDGLLDRHAAFLRVRDALLERDPASRDIWTNAWLGRKFPTRDYHWEPEELYDYWEGHRSEFATPAELSWQWVLVKVTPDRPEADAKALAEELRVVGDEQPEWLAHPGRGPLAWRGLLGRFAGISQREAVQGCWRSAARRRGNAGTHSCGERISRLTSVHLTPEFTFHEPVSLAIAPVPSSSVLAVARNDCGLLLGTGGVRFGLRLTPGELWG